MPARSIPNARRRCGTPRRIAPLLLSGLFLGFAPVLPTEAQPVRPEQATAGQSIAAHIAEASQRFGIPEPWIRAVLRAESAGDMRAVSSAGAMGLMQIMPDTWAELRLRHGLGRDPFDPRDNILAGTAYLREMLDRYGNIAAMLAAYNAGPGRYDEHLATGRSLPAETRAYVAQLAPILGAEVPAAIPVAAPPPPPDWREAPLFVDRSGRNEAAGPAPPERTPTDTPAAAPVQVDRPAGAPQTGIFLARNSAGERP
ncbi:Lytic transglycosylase [Devosia sp. LC5]|uniref:lytic transglycosylase domain-containing protein n=1 Tax=Devosia sp. LC5 TaxID=1502724 RepID=UPI0004E2CFCC|nr:lytic transglycosylase domain-containing protein [Devosia sp. LC5]KFC62050.1 Lytic transglycosylase [Devosia sp. LC5]